MPNLSLKAVILLILLSVSALQTRAQFFYTTNAGTLMISAYTGGGGAVAIPSSVYGMSVAGITDNAFYENSSITSITLPSSLASIGKEAFAGCTGLTSIALPSSLTAIEGSAFYRCTSLASITVEVENQQYSSLAGVLFNKNLSTLIECPAGRQGSYTIPSGVTSIGWTAFASCSGLTNIVIPSSVASIGISAFDGCTGLTSISLPSSLTAISWGMFYDCSSLTSVIIPNSVTSIGEFAFNNCTGLTSIIIPTNVTTISRGMCSACSSLTNVTIPNSVTFIGRNAFSDCTSLTSVAIPNSVTSIDGAAFSDCTSLTSVFFQGNAPTPLDDSIFYGTTATAYYLFGTTGWGATFGGIPTAVYTAPPPTLGISTYGSNNFPVVFFPPPAGTNFVLQTTTNLTSSVWQTISNGIPTSGLIITNVQPAAFFRLKAM